MTSKGVSLDVVLFPVQAPNNRDWSGFFATRRMSKGPTSQPDA
jgi:hypothetical protein